MTVVYRSLAGKVFGAWFVLRRIDDHVCPGGQKLARYLCRCLTCGERKPVMAASLSRGYSRSCKKCAGPRGAKKTSVRLPSGKTISEVARTHGIALDTVYHRWIRGWPEAALCAPVKQDRRSRTVSAPLLHQPRRRELPDRLL